MKSSKTDCKTCGSLRLSICNLGMAVGIVWGVSAFLLAILSMHFNYGTPVVRLLSSVYIGYVSTFGGAFIGLLWGFVDGFVGGALIAWIYNLCRCCCPCKSCKKDRSCH